MYRPNFCAECGNKIIRLHWHPWTSGRFCDQCAKRLRKHRFIPPVIALVTAFSFGFIGGRATRPKPPPLLIQRAANSPLFSATGTAPTPALVIEEVYTCGARTKKGTPCSRRVHGFVRCWQHKGKPAMLPQDKLVVKD